MKDFNGKRENEFVRRYDTLDEIPESTIKQFDILEDHLPVYESFTEGSSVGLFESLSDALASFELKQ